MDTFIQLSNGQLVNKNFASAQVLQAAEQGIYKYVNQEGQSTPSTQTSGGSLVPGTPEYQSRLNELMNTARNIKTSADKLAAEQASRDSGIVSSSTSVRQDESATKLSVDGLTQGFNEEQERNKIEGSSSMQYLIDYERMLEERRQREIEGINKSFDEQKRQQEGAQTREKGATSVSLARIGGYLGGTASATGAMLTLAETHRNEMSLLESQRGEAIRLANQAITDKQFEVAKLKVEEAKDIERELEKRKQQFFQNNLAILQEQRQQDSALREKFKEELEAFALLGDDAKIDPAKAKEIDEFYGVPGFTEKYVNVTRASAQAKSQKEVIQAQKDMVALLKDIPAGQTIRFPDGTEYTGIGSAGDVSTFQETDADGVVRMFHYNKITGEMSTTNLGLVGKPQTGGGESSPRVSEAEQALSELRNPSTGFVPLDAYRDMYQEYIRVNQGKGKEFLDNFDPLLWTGRSIDGTKFFTPSGSSTEEDEPDSTQ